MLSSAHAALMLVLVTVLWGLSFPLVKNWQNAAAACPGGEVVASVTLIALRMLLGLLVFAMWRPRLLFSPNRRDYRIGFLIGFVNFLGFAPQILGLASTTPALSGFFTSLCSAWVPVLAFLCFRHAFRPVMLMGLVLGLAGAGILGLGKEGGWSLNVGDWLTLLASFLFAIEILMIDRLGRTVTSGHLTAGFFIGTGLPALLVAWIVAASGPGVGNWLAWTGSMLSDTSILRDLALLTLLSSVLSSHWLVVYQPRVSAGRAALIYLLEPLFASVFSIAWGHDTLSLYLILGGILILSGNLLVSVLNKIRV
jgi:drug/metabolite transporter (DMT)-like permease